MAATLAEIRQGIADNLEDAFTDSVQTSPYMLDSPTPPTIQVMGPDAVAYDQAMAGGMDEFTMVLQAFAGGPTDRGAQEQLDEWISNSGSRSVKQAVEADKTLGGKVEDLQVQRSSGYRIYNLPNRGEALGCEFFIRVLNTGTAE